MNHHIRQIIADRLHSEATRKQVEVTSIASDSGLAQEVVDGYLRGTRELRWSEFVRICRAIYADPMWLLSSDYQPSRLVYRNSAKARHEAARIENTFLLIHKALPTRAKPPRKSSPRGDSPAELMTGLIPIVREFHEEFGNVQELYKRHHLKVLGVHPKRDRDFDAFLVSCQENYLVCVNLDVSDIRIEFSLLHEFAHFIFDADQDIPIDIKITGADLYGDKISKEVKPEYVANKFAQLWLVPFETAEKMAKVWPDPSACIDYIKEHQISPDVVANAVYDVVRFDSKTRISYVQIRDAIKSGITQRVDRSEIKKFIDEETLALRKYLTRYLEDAQEERRTEILSAWGG